MARYQILVEGGVWDLEAGTRVTPSATPDQWRLYQEWVTAGGVPLPPDPVGQQDIASAKAARIADIDAYAAGLRNAVIRGRSVGEMASWAIKLNDAIAVAAGQPSPYAALLPALGAALGLPAVPGSVNAALAAVRGISEAEHVAKVLNQGGQFLVAEVALDAVRGAHCDAINACATVQEIIAYNWRAGWPELPQ